MRAAYIERLGDPGVIRYGELPDPLPGPGQVLVRVAAVAVDSVDTYLRSGRWQTELRFPLALGRDLVGTVAALGDGVSDLHRDEWVWTNSAGFGGRPGATAELVAVARGRLYRLPAGADPVAFVACVHPGATAYGALVGRARLRAGECAAVIGANGAVGLCAIQAAAAVGAEVIAVTRERSARARLREAGAAHVVLADAAEAPGAAAKAAGAAASAVVRAAGAGIDVLIDTSGHLDVGSVPGRLNPRGRLILIAARGRAELDLWPFYTRELALLGFVMSAMTEPELATAAAWINATHPSRPLTVPVGRVLGFQDAAQAHRILEAGELPRMDDGTVGRIFLRSPAAAG